MSEQRTPKPLKRRMAQFFFEIGYGAAYAEALIRNDMRPPFPFSDALVEHAWGIAGEAHDDPAEFDRHLAIADAAPELLSIVQRFIALPGGAWHPERHAHEEADLMLEARAAIAKATGGVS